MSKLNGRLCLVGLTPPFSEGKASESTGKNVLIDDYSSASQYNLRALKSPSRLREGTGWAVSAYTKDFAPKDYQGRNIIKMKKSAARIFTFTFRSAEHIVSKIYRVKHIVPKAYRVPKAPKMMFRTLNK